jgi:hypothetical protein
MFKDMMGYAIDGAMGGTGGADSSSTCSVRVALCIKSMIAITWHGDDQRHDGRRY